MWAFPFRANGLEAGHRIPSGLENRFFYQSGKAERYPPFVGLTLPIQRVINARFALVNRDQGLISPVCRFEVNPGAKPDAAKLQHSYQVLRWKRVRNSESSCLTLDWACAFAGRSLANVVRGRRRGCRKAEPKHV
jgi:hypothetical protein